jgi:hypothetical protein
MRQETINIYKFDELPTDAAKERARERGRQWVGDDPSWNTESRQSIEAFCDHFGVKLTDWSIGAHCSIDYSTNAENSHFRGVKLSQFDRQCMPTGFYLDCELWMTFYDEFKRTGDAKGAFDAALYAGFKAWRADLESQLEDEYIDDFLSINQYEFDECGSLI